MPNTLPMQITDIMGCTSQDVEAQQKQWNKGFKLVHQKLSIYKSCKDFMYFGTLIRNDNNCSESMNTRSTAGSRCFY